MVLGESLGFPVYPTRNTQCFKSHENAKHGVFALLISETSCSPHHQDAKCFIQRRPTSENLVCSDAPLLNTLRFSHVRDAIRPVRRPSATEELRFSLKNMRVTPHVYRRTTSDNFTCNKSFHLSTSRSPARSSLYFGCYDASRLRTSGTAASILCVFKRMHLSSNTMCNDAPESRTPRETDC